MVKSRSNFRVIISIFSDVRIFYFYGQHEVFLKCFRGNNVTDVKEVKKLQCIPMLRALVLSGKMKLLG